MNEVKWYCRGQLGDVEDMLDCNELSERFLYEDEDEDEEEQQRRDEKNGLYPDREDIAN